MQQSSVTQSLVFWGCGRLLYALKSFSQRLLVSTVLGMVSSLHSTSDFCTCTCIYQLRKQSPHTQVTQLQIMMGTGKIMGERGRGLYIHNNILRCMNAQKREGRQVNI